ncbi:MAG: thermonuclease family protein [Anaerolineales bacterium]|nr:thermonuclease family protein [Anaerolineales bacterium]
MPQNKEFFDISLSLIAVVLIIGASMLACAPDRVSENSFPEPLSGEGRDIYNSFSGSESDCIPASEQEIGFVTYVYDGDTIEVVIDNEMYRVRYIGIDTPERDEYFYQDSKDVNEQMVYHKNIVLIKDVSETDQYGRLLRYIFVGKQFVNYDLVSQGYATAVTFPPDVACYQTFQQAEQNARDAQLGLWKSPE